MAKKSKKRKQNKNQLSVQVNQHSLKTESQKKDGKVAPEKSAEPVPEKKSFDLYVIPAVLILLGLELFFWRNIIFTDNMLGDLGDGRFTALITEHWWQFLCGRERFGSIPIFYPNHTALGYSDLHLGFGVFHSLFRLLGMDLYLAFKWSVFALHLLGLVTMFYMLRRTLGVGTVWSMFGTVAFSHCCALSAVSLHPQLFAAGMLPLLFIFYAGFVHNFEQRKKRNLYAYLTLFWFAFLTYTSWYMACFTGIFCLVFIIGYLFLMKGMRPGVSKRVSKWFSEMGFDILGYIVFFIVLYIPFLSIYIPVIREGSLYTYSGYYLPDPIDLINVTESNAMFGWLMRLLQMSARGRDHEVAEGFSLIALVMFLIVVVHLFSKRGKREKEMLVIPKTVAVSVLVCLLLMIRWDGEDGSLWAIVYALLPPAKALHAVARFLLWLCFPMSAVTAYWADKMPVFQGKGKGLVISCLILGLMAFSTVRVGGLMTLFTHSDRKAFMDSISEAPQDMQSFYIVDSAKTGEDQYVYQLDAWEVAEQTGIPTLNGYSGHYPAGWGVWDICGEYYEEYAAYWAQQYGLEKVYAYDRATNSWSAR